MKYRTPFIGHMLFIYFYLSPVAFSFFPSASLSLSLSLFQLRSSSLSFLVLFSLLSFSLLIMHSYRRWQIKKRSPFYRTHTVLVISAGCSLCLCLFLSLSCSLTLTISLSLSLSLWTLTLVPWPRGLIARRRG